MTDPARVSVLVACADADILRGVVSLFPQSHYAPLAARAGLQVTEALKTQRVSIAIVHEQLADMAGHKLVTWLRQSLGPAAVLVFLTTKLPPRDLNIGQDHALRYPAAPGILIDLVRKQYNKRVNERHRPGFVAEVRQRAEGMENQDYYALLGVSRGATHDVIRNAYDLLSLRFHPDQHLDLKETSEYESLLGLYKRIGEAYRTLTDSRRRVLYDKRLAGGVLRLDDSIREQVGPKSLEEMSTNQTVKRFLRMAQTAIASGNRANALQNLKFALSMEPDNQALVAKVAELES